MRMIIHIARVIDEERASTVTREQILAAALDLLAERGFYGTTMPALAARASVGAGTPYRHFGSKEEIVNAVYRRCKEGLMAALLEDFPFDAPAREQFRTFVALHSRAIQLIEPEQEHAIVDDVLDSRVIGILGEDPLAVPAPRGI